MIYRYLGLAMQLMLYPVWAVEYLGFHFRGGSKYFWKSGGICKARRKATSLLGGFGGMLPEKIFKNGTIWCVLENILLKFCKKKCI